MTEILKFVLHIDEYLIVLSQQYGGWIYGILFGVIFMETGLVVTPFLPGDSLLFAAGALAAMGGMQIITLWILMGVAAFLGDTANYWIGHYIGEKAFDPNFVIKIGSIKLKVSKVLKPEYLHKAQEFYKKHGGKAIVLARFVPIVRTFAPFVAGISKMHYQNFISYNLIGGWVWVTVFLGAGYFFGNIPFVKANFELVAVGIILVSVVPIVIEAVKAKKG